MRYLSAALCVGVWFLANALMGPSAALEASQPRDQPVVVELFTSQGCSSCPPADALLGELAESPGVIALSLHVDYWDYIGWEDPYASPQMTKRQRSYARELGLHYVYTPQMVVDGVANVVGSRRRQVLQTVAQRAADGKPLRVHLGHDGGGTVFVSGGDPAAGPAEVWLVFFDERHETPVQRGENAGRTVENFNVVRQFRSIGTWTGEALEIEFDLDDPSQAGSYGCAVLVQQDGTGPILGAALMIFDH